VSLSAWTQGPTASVLTRAEPGISHIRSTLSRGAKSSNFYTRAAKAGAFAVHCVKAGAYLPDYAKDYLHPWRLRYQRRRPRFLATGNPQARPSGRDREHRNFRQHQSLSTRLRRRGYRRSRRSRSGKSAIKERQGGRDEGFRHSGAKARPANI